MTDHGWDDPADGTFSVGDYNTDMAEWDLADADEWHQIADDYRDSAVGDQASGPSVGSSEDDQAAEAIANANDADYEASWYESDAAQQLYDAES